MPETIIDVKEATTAALQYFQELYNGPFTDLAVEEVEKSGNKWSITIGYSLARRGLGGAVIAVASANRQYKQIVVDANSGEVLSMKVRKF